MINLFRRNLRGSALPVLVAAFGGSCALSASVFAQIVVAEGAEDGRDRVTPNVVLIMADDLGWGDVGFNGGTMIATPHLDDWAADGVILDRFYAASSVCSPTRASVLTGRHPHRLGVLSANIGHLAEAETTLPDFFHEAGYATGIFGNSHLGTLTRTVQDANRGGPRGADHFSPPQLHGFDRVLATESKVPTYDPMVRPRGIDRNTWWSAATADQAEPYGTRYWDEAGQQVTQGLAGDDSILLARNANAFIRETVAAGDSFFVVLWFHAPHLPVVINPDYAEAYAHLPPYDQAYACAVAGLDQAVGDLRAALQAAGVEGETIVWFCSDNGPEGRADDSPGSAGPFRGRKRALYDGGIRVPTFVAGPIDDLIEGEGAPATGERYAGVASTSDILPTLARIAGLDINALALDGEALHTGGHRPIFFVFQNRNAVLMDGDKIVRTGTNQPWERFDSTLDAAEADPILVTDDDAAVRAWQQFEQSLTESH